MSLRHIDMHQVHLHYHHRLNTSKQLINFLSTKQIEPYVTLALGLENPEGNYSAWEHNLGDQILISTRMPRIFQLAETLADSNTARTMLNEVYNANIPYLKVSVGSEMAMLLRPQTHWVANARTVWAHLLVLHKFDYEIANEALSLYRDGDRDSLMNYEIWREIHRVMKPDLLTLAEMGIDEAKHQNVAINSIESIYIWADAVANALYQQE